MLEGLTSCTRRELAATVRGLPKSGMSVTDIDQWQPCMAFYQRFRTMNGSMIVRASFLGYVYAPLILLDQAFFHRTVRHFDPESGKPI